MKQIIKMQFGSHVYGTNVPTSDHDYKSIVLPVYRDIVLQRPFEFKKEATKQGSGKNTKDDIDHGIFGLHHWLHLLVQGQTLCYDMLFTPKSFWLETEYFPAGVWEELVSNSDKLVNSRISAFAGYCQSQAAKYSLKGSNLAAYRKAIDFFSEQPSRMKLQHIRDKIKTELVDTSETETKYNGKSHPVIQLVEIEHKVNGKMEEYLQVGPKSKIPMTAHADLARQVFQEQFNKYGERAKQAETNNGIDWKALMHAVRVCKEAEELLLTGRITFPRPEASVLLQIRKGELSYKAVEDLIVKGLDDITAAKEKTSLPDAPNEQWIEDFLFDVYSTKTR